MRTVKYKRGYAYITVGTHHYQLAKIRPEKDIITDRVSLTKDGLLSVSDGYAWNGVNFLRDHPVLMTASLIHDVLTQLVRLGLLDRKWIYAVHEELRDTMIDNEAPGLWVRAVYWARRFMHKSLNPSSEPMVYTAP